MYANPFTPPPHQPVTVGCEERPYSISSNNRWIDFENININYENVLYGSLWGYTGGDDDNALVSEG